MDPQKSQEAFENLMRTGQNLMQGFFDQLGKLPMGMPGTVPLGMSMPTLPPNLEIDPEKLAQLQREHLEKHTQLWQSMLGRGQGDKNEPVIKPHPSDRRFKAPEWVESPYYEYIHQAYLINAQFLSSIADALPVSDKVARGKLQFMMRQYIDAMSPANYAATNPEFIKRAIETKGKSITDGMMNLISDMEKGSISMTDDSAFEVGTNLANTEGSVIYENELMQLIQYAPLTDKVHERPLLIVPPCINKYYILDLQPENSYVRYAVEQGMTVFLISWRNATAEQTNLTWDDYIEDGILNALEIVRDVTKVQKPNALGFCIGGTMLATALATAYARGEDPVESLSLLTTMIDFSDTGDLACFVDEASVAKQESTIGKGGLMTGREFSSVFSSLRPNDLVWNYVVDNYLRGNKPSAFDLLYWNADATNLPGPFLVWYLRNAYLENNLRVPGKVKVLGKPMDFKAIECPAYFVATREDHIVPWKTAYLGRRLLSGDTTFVLGASGHIAGIVNHPAKGKRSYWTNSTSAAATADDWLHSATEHKGSWWTDWVSWLKDKSGKQIAPRKIGSREYKVIEPAPGRYVRAKA